MTIKIKGTGITLTPEITEYLDKRLEAVQKFLPKDSETFIADVELGRTTKHHQTGDIFRAEITIHKGKETFRAVSEASDLFAAIDDLKNEITRELSSFKKKKLSLLRRGGQKIKRIIRRS